MFELFQLGVFFSVTPKSQFSPANWAELVVYEETGRNQVSASPHGAYDAIFKCVFALAGDKGALGSCSSARKMIEKQVAVKLFMVLLLRIRGYWLANSNINLQNQYLLLDICLLDVLAVAMPHAWLDNVHTLCDNISHKIIQRSEKVV